MNATSCSRLPGTLNPLPEVVRCGHSVVHTVLDCIANSWLFKDENRICFPSLHVCLHLPRRRIVACFRACRSGRNAYLSCRRLLDVVQTSARRR